MEYEFDSLEKIPQPPPIYFLFKPKENIFKTPDANKIYEFEIDISKGLMEPCAFCYKYAKASDILAHCLTYLFEFLKPIYGKDVTNLVIEYVADTSSGNIHNSLTVCMPCYFYACNSLSK